MYHFEMMTPLGRIRVFYDDLGVKFLHMGEKALHRGETPLIQAARKEKIWLSLYHHLKTYFCGQGEGRKVDFRPFPWSLPQGITPFTREVLTLTRDIPWGQVTSYGTLARALGRPGAARAAGRALASNPLPLIIPCHRVVREGGEMGGYSLGANIKRELLKLENIHIKETGRVDDEVFIRW